MPHAGNPQRAFHRGVGLVRDVHRRPRSLATGALLQGDGERGQVGGGTSADEQPLGGQRHPADLAQPVEDDRLHHRRSWRSQPRAGEDAEPGGQSVGQHRDRIAGERDKPKKRGWSTRETGGKPSRSTVRNEVGVAPFLGQRARAARASISSAQRARRPAGRAAARADRRARRPRGGRAAGRLRGRGSGENPSWESR